MRTQVALTAIALLAAGPTCHAAPAFWSGGSAQPAAKQAAQPSEQGFFSKLMFGDKSAQAAPAPTTLMGVPHEPSRTAKMWNAVKSPFAGEPTQPPQAPDVLSLATPTGQLSVKALLVKAQLSELNHDPAGAKALFTQALAQNPNDSATLREIARFEDRQEHLDIAEQMYRRAVTAAPRDAGLINDLALCCARQGNLDESAELLAGAIRLQPQKTLYRNNIAKVLVKLDQPEAALRHLAAAHPPAVAQYNLGHLLQESGKEQAALACFQEAVALDPQLQAASRAVAKLTPSQPTVQVAAAPRVPAVDPSPAATTTAPSEEWAADEVVDDNAPLLLPPVRE